MSNDIPESLKKFEGQLERAVKRRLELASARRRRARPRILAGTTLAVAGLAAALVLVLSAASSPPAFALTRNHDGSISVTIMRPAGLREANAKLASMKIRARFVPVAIHCGMSGSPPPPGNWSSKQAPVRIKPWQIRKNRTLVIGVRRNGRTATWSRGSRGPVPGCLPPGPPGRCHPHKGKGTLPNKTLKLKPGSRTQVQVPACPQKSMKGAGAPAPSH